MGDTERAYGQHLCEQTSRDIHTEKLLYWADKHPWKARELDVALGLKPTSWWRRLIGCCAMAIYNWALQTKSKKKNGNQL